MTHNLRTTLTGLAVAVTTLIGSTAMAEPWTGKKVIFLGADDICEYCAAYNGLIRDAAEEAGIELEVVTNKFDAAQQATQVDQAIAKKPDAILMWTIDGTALFPAMRKIKRAEIPLLLTNVQPDEKMDDLWIQYSGGNYIEQGRRAAQLMVDAFEAKGFGKSGKVFLITGYIGQAQTISMAKGFTDELAALAPEIEVVGSQPGNWDTGTATQAASGLFTKFGDEIKGVYAQEDVMMQGVLIAAERAGIDPATLATVGNVCEPVGIKNIKAGRQYGTVLQSPIDEVAYTIGSIKNYFAGEEMAKSNYIPLKKVTAANVDDVCTPWPGH